MTVDRQANLQSECKISCVQGEGAKSWYREGDSNPQGVTTSGF